MGKVKSAIITALLVAAIIVLGLFATVSFPVVGSDGIQKIDSFISRIHLDGNLTGEAYTVLYPEGVVTASDYELGMPEDETKRQEYIDKYSQYGNYYIEKDSILDGGIEQFTADVKKDAAVLNDRFSQKGYTSYSVAVVDKLAIKITVPTGFTYSEYKEYDSTGRTNDTEQIEQSIALLSYSGELTLRNTEVGNANSDGILTKLNENASDFFKSVSKRGVGGSYSIKIKLTDYGKGRLREISSLVSSAGSDNAIHFYIGDTQLLALTVTEAINQKTFYIPQNTEDNAADCSIVLNSVVNGNTLSHEYDVMTESGASNVIVVTSTAKLGKNAAIFFGCAILAILVAAIVALCVRYKKLGIVTSLVALVYTLAMIIVLMLTGVQLTLAGAFTAVLGLALLVGSNVAAFENVRRETKKGKTMQSAVKSGYRGLLASILELHIVILVASLFFTLVGKGELAACGLILLVATIASYILYWFTRFMWYTLSSPARDKFAFGGYKREVIDD